MPRQSRFPRLSFLLLSAAVALAGCLAGCSDARRNAKPALTLRPCWLPGIEGQARCGSLEVFEDRAAKTGRTLSLHIAVLPALAASPEPDPVVILAGGPGQGAISVARAILPSAERLRRSRDLVFVDQRGTGDSHPLPCELTEEGAPLSASYKDTFEEAGIRGCLAKLDADPRQYTTPIAMDDLDDVREALGYQTLNLWGTSYGTRAALVYLRQHPAQVRTMILDGVAPMSLYLPLSMPRDGQRAMDLLLSRCAADAACARAYPDLGPRLTAFLDKLRSEPLRARVAHPRSGRIEDVEIPFDGFVGALRSLLYIPEATSLVPWMLDRAMRGELAPFVAATTGLDAAIAGGMYFSVICAEDAPFYRDEDLEREAQGTVFGPGAGRATLRACQWWPRGELPPRYREPVASDKPVLLLSGELDPVTPPSWAEDAKKTLPNALSVVVLGVGHNTTATGCVRKLMAEFVRQGSGADLDAGCANALARPPFFTSFAGPEP